MSLYERYLSGFDLVDRNDTLGGAVTAVTATAVDSRIASASVTSNNVTVKAGTQAGNTIVDVKVTVGGKTYTLLFRVFVGLVSSAALGTLGQREADVAAPMVDGGQQHAVALKADGTVWAWGLGTSGQLGNGHSFDATFPVLVHEAAYVCPECGTLVHESTDAKAGVLTSSAHALECPNCNKVFNRDMYIPAATDDEPDPAPVAVEQAIGSVLENIVMVSAGEGFSLALDNKGNVWAWGEKENVVPGTRSLSARMVDFSQSKDESTTANYAVPTIVAISAGYDHAMALDSNGTVWTWGNDNKGQLGVDNVTGKGGSASMSRRATLRLTAMSASTPTIPVTSIWTMWWPSPQATSSPWLCAATAASMSGVPTTITSWVWAIPPRAPAPPM